MYPPENEYPDQGLKDLSPREILPLIRGVIGRDIRFFDSVASTNITALDMAQNAHEGTVVIADEQTAGKGRLKRVWLSPEGTISLSVILYPGIADLPSLIMLASLAVVHSIEMTTGLRSQLKWPNDVLLSGRKVAGILTEGSLPNVLRW